MTPYKNISRNSAVVAYEIGSDYIVVQFDNGSVYQYSHRRPGYQAVREMSMLAQNGQGLGTFINKNVRKNYDRRIR